MFKLIFTCLKWMEDTQFIQVRGTASALTTNMKIYSMQTIFPNISPCQQGIH